MSDTPNPSDRTSADKPKPTQRDAVEKLLATAPFRSAGATTLGGRRLEYRVEAAFVPREEPLRDTQRVGLIADLLDVDPNWAILCKGVEHKLWGAREAELNRLGRGNIWPPRRLVPNVDALRCNL